MLNALKNIREDHEDGFTLIELLVVILIIGILAAIAIPTFMNQRKAANDSAVESDVKNAAVSVETWLVSNPGATAIKTEELDLVFSEGSHLAVSGDANQFCVQGWHDNGKQYTEESKATYDSANGGFKKGVINCDAGAPEAGGPIDVSPVAQTVKFNDNGTEFTGEISAVANGDGGIDVIGNASGHKPWQFQGNVTDVTCKDSGVKGIYYTSSLMGYWGDSGFTATLGPWVMDPNCEAVSVTIDKNEWANSATVAEQVTVPVIAAQKWEGTIDTSKDIRLFYSDSDNPSNITYIDSKFNFNVKDGKASWTIDNLNQLPGHIIDLGYKVDVICDGGNPVSQWGYGLEGAGTVNTGSCAPTSVAITSAAQGANTAGIETVTLRLS